eukprot:Tamp_04649.p1 GENE.Tamp_04649~~Tamp_04649.p1  ORF type:complete len:798 (+),score=167.98 Tamp_04649:99-2492(+)
MDREPPSGPFEWDAWISFRTNEFGRDEELAIQLYTLLTAKSFRVFYAPICLPEKTKHNAREWEEKYLHACANSAIAIPLVSRHTFKGRNFDMTKYVWSSNPDELLMEWDLMLELYDRGRLKDILPMLVGDLTDAQKQRAQSRIMQKLRIDSLDEKHVTHRLRELFNFADKDRSGFIDRDELAECFKRFGLGLTDDELDDLLENADDGDCEIDVFEFEDLIMQLLEDKAGVILRPEKSKQKHANLSREDTIKAIKHASSPLAMREAGFSPDGSTVRKSPKSPGARSPGARSPGAKKNSSNVSNASPAVDRSEGSSRPGTRGDPLGGSRPATRGEAIQEEDGEGREDAGFKSAAGDKFKRATSADLEDMWKQLEEDGAEVSAPSSPLRSENPEFYTDFSESGCAPPMTSTVVAQAQRRITAWLHHDLKYGTNEVLWRAKHCRPVPSMDSESGGRTIKQTVECILGFPAHKVAGMANAQLERMLKAAHKCWELAVKLPAPVLKKGVPRPKEVLCETTGRPAKYMDPLTLVPFRDMHTFHQRRQCFYFDIKRCHEDIIMENHGTRVTCTQSAGRSVMLTPPIGAIGTSYVEFEIQHEGRNPYFFFGVCEGRHDVSGGWTAHADETAALYFAYDGKKQLNGEMSPYTSTEIRRMDRIGLLVDMDREVFEILVNDESQGVLTEKLPRPMFFVVDMGWPYQRIEILPRTHWQMLATMLLKFFKGMDAQERLKAMAELFNKYDVDGQGSIDRDEFRDALESMHVHLSDQELEELIAKVDEDGSGEIEFNEFKAMIDSMIEEYGPG